MSLEVDDIICFRTSNITKLPDINNSYSFGYQKNSYIFIPRFERKDSWDCGGVSTPGLGQGEGPDGDKWSKTTQETLGGAGVSEANGALRNPNYPPGVTIYIEKRLTNQSY